MAGGQVRELHGELLPVRRCQRVHRVLQHPTGYPEQWATIPMVLAWSVVC